MVCERERKREFLTWGYAGQNRSTRQKKSPTTVTAQISAIFPYLGTRFLKSNGHSIKWAPACASAQNQTVAHRAFDGNTPMGPAPTKKTQRRRLEKSLGRDSKHPSLSCLATGNRRPGNDRRKLLGRPNKLSKAAFDRQTPSSISAKTGAISPSATNQPYFAFAASHAAEASRAKRRSRRAGRDFPDLLQAAALPPPRAPPLWRRRSRQCQYPHASRKNAATATSFAAFITHGSVPPVLPAYFASLKQRNVSSSTG